MWFGLASCAVTDWLSFGARALIGWILEDCDIQFRGVLIFRS